ncbi:hypothetical protein K491DRAFT_707704 [Lophiostoma macrostomum CBS 122681]|uniref:Uncharacterized protein n=1 Tax=Lophiostoma macrostomum CBS 122681 TaxID=1314788 RepID=A0A6A6SQV8_9PLEO|nr:hypothetical protein K491DRAFT_707704 [Lophiostoma macrostomum CBS 122681]
MFRAQVLRRGFSLWTRVPTSQLVRSAQRDGLETIHIQRVRVKHPLLSRRRLLTAAVVWTAFYGLVRWLDGEDEDEEQEEAESKKRRAQLRRIAHQKDANSDDEDAVGAADGGDGGPIDEEEDEEDEEGEALFFLPTGFSRPKPRTFWKGSDPEWQEFRRIAQDKERVVRIRGELTSTVRDVIGRHPHLKRALGTVDPKKGRVWLELVFPDGPPPEFERPGIEITEDLEVRSSTRPVHMVAHQRLQRLLVPLPVAHSLYVDGKSRAWTSWQDFRTYIGWESDATKKQQALKKILATPGLPSPPTSPSASSTPAPNEKSHANEAPQQPVAPTSSPQKEPATSGEQNAAFHRFLPSLPSTGDMTLNLSAFHQTFRRYNKGPPRNIPRGALQVSGLIEVIGNKGKMDIDVRAIYDPKDGQYKAVDMTPRNFKEHRQRPRGGP